MSDQMSVIDAIAPLREQVREWRRADLSIALVPTMGNLHRGHLELVQVAREHCDRVVTSLFVNPLQFGPREDYAQYPRTPEEDADLLRAGGNHCLFVPSEEVVYPRGRKGQTQIEVPVLSNLLCGASRPGHFRGVATVVLKLFNMVQPDLATFGEKDFQQLVLIRRMTTDLDLPIRIVGVPTVRDDDGLAMSSRNAYLTPGERAVAPLLYHTLTRAVAALKDGASPTDVEWDAARALAAGGMRTDYISVRRRSDLAPVAPGDRALVILAAAYLGRTRLIDNLSLDLA